MSERSWRSARSGPGRQRHAKGRVTLDQLRTFVAVAQREHVTAAAEALDQSQGSVSTQVRRLERILGLPLLHRVGRNVRLTDVGHAVQRLALLLLEQADALENLAASYLVADRGEVRVVAGSVIGTHRLSSWVGPFARAHPKVDVHIHLSSVRPAMDSLAAGSVDVVLLGAAVPAPGMETLALEETELVIVVAAQHPLATSRAPLEELSRHRHLTHERGSATRAAVDQLLGTSANGAVALELEEGALLASLRAGLGFAVMPRAIVDHDVTAGTLVVVPSPGTRVPVVFTAVRRPGASTPAVDAFWQHLAGRAGSSRPKESFGFDERNHATDAMDG